MVKQANATRLRDIDARQRSVVFSDAVQNEAQLADVNDIDWHREIQ